MDQITEIMANALTRLIKDDFGLPIHAFSVASNGSIFLAQYEESPSQGLDITILYERINDDTFLFPINIVFVGASGKAARMVIERTGDEGSLQYLN